MKRLEEISIPIFILAIVILAAFVLVLRAQDTTMPVQTGTVSLTSANLQLQGFTTNDLWLEVVSVSNATACLVIHVPWNVTNGVYDLFYTTNLTPPSTWICLSRCAPGQTNFVVTNLADPRGFFILGLTNDVDGDGLTDAYEKLVSHTDPNSPLTITTQPANQWVIQGSNATFSVTAVGGALSYQWYFNSAMLGAATNAILILNNVQTNNAGNYYVVVTNMAGSVTSSNAVLTVLVPPSAISGLQLWLEANAGITTNTAAQISTWADQSGNTNNATQSNTNNQPLYVINALNSLPVVRFNPTNSQYFNLPNLFNGTTQAEAFVVLRAAADMPGTSRALWQFGAITYYPDSGGNIVEDFGSTSLHTVGNPAQPLDQYHVYEVASQSGNWSAWINGMLQSSTTTNTYSTNVYPTLGNSGSYYFAGDVAEVLVFNRVLSADERDTVNGYLNLKYGMIPRVSITTPTNNSVFVTGSDVGLTASAFEVAGGTIKQVEYFQGTNSLGLSMNAPYSVTWNNVAASSLTTNIYALTARVTGNNGLMSTSDIVNIKVDPPPTISITNPTNNAYLGIAPVNITINATASDVMGVSQVQFFQGTNNLGVLTNAPYNLVWSNVPAGNYSLTAVTLGNDGFSTTSSTVNVLVDTDADSDGLGDVQEYLYGTNPNVSDGFWIWIGEPDGGLTP
jgi:hypothetical protein